MTKRTKKPGYTLLELLISIAIFSGVMILAIGAFSRSATSSARSNITRAKSEAARTVIDQISNDFRYISNDAPPYGCPANSPGFCLKPANFTALNSVSLLLKYPDQTTYVMKTYYVTAVNFTVRVIEDRDCTLNNGNVTAACQPLVGNAKTLLNPDYYLADDNVFSGTANPPGEVGFLSVKLNLRPKAEPSCSEPGVCYQLSTTLVPGGF